MRTALLEVILRLSDSADAERQRANEKQELLIAELNHRVRNILSLIRGLISQTRESAQSVEDFIGTLESRVHALARAHDQITADRWSPARLIDLIEVEAGAYLAERSDPQTCPARCRDCDGIPRRVAHRLLAPDVETCGVDIGPLFSKSFGFFGFFGFCRGF